MSKRYNNIGFDTEHGYFELGFTLKEVDALGSYLIANKGNIDDKDFFKFALEANSDAGYISNKKAEYVLQGLRNGIELEDDFLEFEEIVGYLFGLYVQAIDDAAKEIEPAIVAINKDSTVDITVDGKTHKLMFTRETAEETLKNGIFDFNSALELYSHGSRLIRAALEHDGKRRSARLHENVFLALWATKFDEETEDDLLEVVNALSHHIKEVVESGVKKSKAAFKVKKN